MSTIIDYIKAIMAEYKKDNVPILAAAQAYYYLLSIVPLLVVCFAIIPYLHMDPNEVMLFLEDVLPSGIAEIFEENIVNIIQTPKGGRSEERRVGKKGRKGRQREQRREEKKYGESSAGCIINEG